MMKQTAITCDDVFEFFTSPASMIDDSLPECGEEVRQHLLVCDECCEFARSTELARNALSDISGLASGSIVARAAKVPLHAADVGADVGLSATTQPGSRDSTFGSNRFDRQTARFAPWQEGFLPTSWLALWFRNIGRRREMVFAQTLAMLVFCVLLSWMLATVLRPRLSTLTDAERVSEAELLPVAEGIPSQAGKQWLVSTGMTDACVAPENVAAVKSEDSMRLGNSGSLPIQEADPLSQWTKATQSQPGKVCCSDCHHAKSSITNSTTRIAALIGQTCLICHTSSSDDVAIFRLE